MSIYKLFPSQDATIYSSDPTLNTGLDEILDLSKTLNLDSTGNINSVTRVLVQFDNTEINNVYNLISSSIQVPISSSLSNFWSASLNLQNADINGLSRNISLLVDPIAQPWDMGLGKYNFNPSTTTGVSWEYATNNAKWIASGSNFTSSFSSGSASISTIGIGGNWFTGSTVSQSFSYYKYTNINVDVTGIVSNWLTGSYNNNGFIIRNTQDVEFDINFNDTLTYYSRDTHTIYPPYLEFKYDDSIYITGSSSIIIGDASDLNINITNNKTIFYPEEVVRINVYPYYKYPDRFFTTSSLYALQYALPKTSYYRILDVGTNTEIISFDTNYTKISYDSTSSFFYLNLSGYEPDRWYKIQILVNLSGSYIYDSNNNYTFKVGNTYRGDYV